MTDYTRRAVRGFGIVFTAMIFTSFMNYLIRLILARSLSIEEYGLIFAVMATVGLFATFMDLGTSKASVKLMSEYKTRGWSVKKIIVNTFTIQISVAVILFSVLFLLRDIISQYYLKTSTVLFSVYVFTLLLNPLSYMFKSFFVSFARMKVHAIMDILRVGTVLTGTVILLKLGFGPMAAIIPCLFFYVFHITLYPRWAKKVADFPSFKEFFTCQDTQTKKKVLSFGMHLALASFAGLIFNYTDIVFITYFKGLSAVGLYSAAMPTVKLLWVFNTAMVTILLPMTSELWVLKDHKRLSHALLKIYRYSLAFVLPASFVMFMFPKEILRILFGSDFVGGYPVLMVLAPAAIVFTLGRANNSMLSGIGQPKSVGRVMLSAAVFNFIANMIVVPRYGITGASISTALAFVIVFIFSFKAILKNIKINLEWVTYIKTIIASLIMVGVIYIIKTSLEVNVYVEILAAVSAAAVVYLIMIFLLKVITFKEFKDLIRRII